MLKGKNVLLGLKLVQYELHLKLKKTDLYFSIYINCFRIIVLLIYSIKVNYQKTVSNFWKLNGLLTQQIYHTVINENYSDFLLKKVQQNSPI